MYKINSDEGFFLPWIEISIHAKSCVIQPTFIYMLLIKLYPENAHKV